VKAGIDQHDGAIGPVLHAVEDFPIPD